VVELLEVHHARGDPARRQSGRREAARLRVRHGYVGLLGGGEPAVELGQRGARVQVETCERADGELVRLAVGLFACRCDFAWGGREQVSCE